MSPNRYDLSLPRAALARLIPRLLEVPGAVAAGPAGLLRSDDVCELLARELALLPPKGAQVVRPGLLVRIAEAPPAPEAWQWYLAEHRVAGWGPLACLAIGRDGSLTGAVWAPSGDWCPVGRIRLPGCGAYAVRLCGAADEPQEDLESDPRWRRPLRLFDAPAYRRLTGLTVAVVGAGGNGSRLALALARLGVRDLVLVDPDCVEAHNLHTVAALPEDIGRLKVEVVGARIRAILGEGALIRLLPQSITRFEVADAVRSADVLVSAVDHDGARLVTAALAALYGRVLLDLGSGLSGDNMGGDVRLIYPGEGRCLYCWGGLARAGEVTAVLEGVWPAPAQGPRQGPDPLLSLNQLVVHLGVRLLEDMVREHLAGSTWLRLEYDNGVPSLQSLEAVPNRPCPVCALASLGDEGLGRLSALVAGIARGQASGETE